MDLVYVGNSSVIGFRGIQETEYGMIVTGFTQRWNNPKEFNNDQDGSPVGFWTSHQRSSTITLEGKVIDEWQHSNLVATAWGSGSGTANNDGMIGFTSPNGMVNVGSSGSSSDPYHSGGHAGPTASGAALAGVTATWNSYWRPHASGGPTSNGRYGLAFTVPIFFANAAAGFGGGAPGEGAFYLDDIEVIQSEGQPVTFRLTATAHPGVQHARG
ncbi:MAG TPA: hypothetical protein VFI76_01935 [Terrimicrobiaceae bacterium]|nr:hypothetical protein [Terrimicrobiaceae bacterium]